MFLARHEEHERRDRGDKAEDAVDEAADDFPQGHVPEARHLAGLRPPGPHIQQLQGRRLAVGPDDEAPDDVADAERDDSQRDREKIGADAPAHAGELGSLRKGKTGGLVKPHSLRHGHRILAVAGHRGRLRQALAGRHLVVGLSRRLLPVGLALRCLPPRLALRRLPLRRLAVRLPLLLPLRLAVGLLTVGLALLLAVRLLTVGLALLLTVGRPLRLAIGLALGRLAIGRLPVRLVGWRLYGLLPVPRSVRVWKLAHRKLTSCIR